MGARSQRVKPARFGIDQPTPAQPDRLVTQRGVRHASETGQFAGGRERRFAVVEQRVMELVAERAG